LHGNPQHAAPLAGPLGWLAGRWGRLALGLAVVA